MSALRLTSRAELFACINIDEEKDVNIISRRRHSMRMESTSHAELISHLEHFVNGNTRRNFTLIHGLKWWDLTTGAGIHLEAVLDSMAAESGLPFDDVLGMLLDDFNPYTVIDNGVDADLFASLMGGAA